MILSARHLLVIALVALATALSACGDDEEDPAPANAPAQTEQPQQPANPAQSAPPVQAAEVTIKEFKYGPPAISVKAGGSVEWTNEDDAPHTATADDDSFDTGSLNKGDAGTVTFDEAGTFSYICTFHPFMKGTVKVVG